MVNSGAYSYIDLLTSAANYSWTRNEVINSNIANVDTPNYKRQDVSFESVLKSAIGKSEGSSDTLTQAVRSVDYDNLQSTVYTDNSELSYRLDGNNVDIDTEQVELASNQLYYEGVVDSIDQSFGRIKTALTTTG